jgi:hypothetical protein
MAPELALETLRKLPPRSVVLDPMAGSGTVLRQATELGHRAVGLDMDPLAVLISRVSTRPCDGELLLRLGDTVLAEARGLPRSQLTLPWIDADPETSAFVRYWFGRPQRVDLRRIAAAVLKVAAAEAGNEASEAALDALRIALSRTIITKDRGASLARDVSHSRPHKVETSSVFEVIPAFERSVRVVQQRLSSSLPRGDADVQLGDARQMGGINAGSIDSVLTSPPYLNAIDYIRGHRLSLVWLGHTVKDLRTIRSNSIGAERSLAGDLTADAETIKLAMGPVDQLPSRYSGMVERFATDILRMVLEVARVLSPQGRATFVVGNSCLKGIFIQNSEAVIAAGRLAGLRLSAQFERALPTQHRYLPIPQSGMLAKRMRTETILTFVHAT